jgi:hypothetical protein
LCAHRVTSSHFRIFGPDLQRNPYTGAFSKAEPSDYNGPRTAKGIVEAVLGLLSDVHVSRPANAASLAEFWEGDKAASADTDGKAAKLPLVALVSEKADVTHLYQALSTQLHQSMRFAQACDSVCFASLVTRHLPLIPKLHRLQPEPAHRLALRQKDLGQAPPKPECMMQMSMRRLRYWSF